MMYFDFEEENEESSQVSIKHNPFR